MNKGVRRFAAVFGLVVSVVGCGPVDPGPGEPGDPLEDCAADCVAEGRGSRMQCEAACVDSKADTSAHGGE